MRINKSLNLSNYSKLVAVFVILILLQTQIMGTNAYISSSTVLQIQNSQDETSYNRFEGYNLLVLEQNNFSTGGFLSRKIVIADLDGNIIIERGISSEPLLADQPIEFINSTTLIYGDYGGAKLWNIETNVTVNLYFEGHHEIEMDHLRDTYFTLDSYEVDINEKTYLFDLINEYNSTGHLIRSIDTRNYVELWQTCPFEDELAILDITHANSLVFDEDEDMMYLNCRSTNTFYKIDHQTGDLIWGLGEHGNFTMYDIYGNQRDYLFFHSHSLEKIGDDRFLLFDNDFHNQTDAMNRHSRLVEITIDEDKMQANVTWEWSAPTDYWSIIWGDCDLLPNNNKLGVFGHTTYLGESQGSKAIEVSNEGEIVWKLFSPIEEDELYEFYRMERIRFSPITSAPIFVDLEDNRYFEWNVWYNFRSKTNFTGEYFIYLDDQLVENKNITFPKYWEPLKVKYYLGEITDGQHQISIVVADEGGHLSIDSEFYENIGSIKFRIGQKIELILGLSLGIGVPVLSVSFFTWAKYFRKKI